MTTTEVDPATIAEIEKSLAIETAPEEETIPPLCSVQDNGRKCPTLAVVLASWVCNEKRDHLLRSHMCGRHLRELQAGRLEHGQEGCRETAIYVRHTGL